MMRCKPCKVTYNGLRYQIHGNGDVIMLGTNQYEHDAHAVYPELAARVRKEAQRQRRNRNARARHAALTSLGLKRTPYGYE